MQEKADTGASVIVKLGYNESVSIKLIGRSFLALDCNACDIFDFFKMNLKQRPNYWTVKI